MDRGFTGFTSALTFKRRRDAEAASAATKYAGGGGASVHLQAMVVGTQYCKGASMINTIGCEVRVERDEGNVHDVHALRVVMPSGEMVGHVEAVCARHLTSFVDDITSVTVADLPETSLSRFAITIVVRPLTWSPELKDLRTFVEKRSKTKGGKRKAVAVAAAVGDKKYRQTTLFEKRRPLAATLSSCDEKRSPSGSSTLWGTLPARAILHILVRVDVGRDLGACVAVCRSWATVARDSMPFQRVWFAMRDLTSCGRSTLPSALANCLRLTPRIIEILRHLEMSKVASLQATVRVLSTIAACGCTASTTMLPLPDHQLLLLECLGTSLPICDTLVILINLLTSDCVSAELVDLIAERDLHEELALLQIAFELRMEGGRRRLQLDLIVLRERVSRRMARGTMPRGRLALTAEQQSIVDFKVRGSDVVLCYAFAGSGKTTVLREHACKSPSKTFLYLCFNKSVAESAAASFPSNIVALNVHRLAYQAIGRNYGAISKSIILPPTYKTYTADERRDAIDALELWFQSDAATITSDMAKDSDNPTRAVSLANGIWKDMLSRTISMTHSGYLKQYQLSRPRLDHKYSAIMLDEAQDVNPVIIDIVISQNLPRIIVGDPHQAIMGFMGSINLMKNISNVSTATAHLTNSFRLGCNVSELCNRLLAFRPCTKGKYVVAGHSTDYVSIATPEDQLGPHTFLSRSNFGVLNRLMTALYVEDKRRTVGLIGGVEGYDVELIRQVALLRAGRNREVQRKELQKFDTFEELECFLDNKKDRMPAWASGLPGAVKFVKCFERHVEDLVDTLGGLAKKVTKNWKDAHLVISNVHKAKGLEFRKVIIGNDFLDLNDGEKFPSGNLSLCSTDASLEEELNLIYVAVSRTKSSLLLTPDHSLLRYLITGGGIHRHRLAVADDVARPQPRPCAECCNEFLQEGGVTEEAIIAGRTGAFVCGACRYLLPMIASSTAY